MVLRSLFFFGEKEGIYDRGIGKAPRAYYGNTIDLGFLNCCSYELFSCFFGVCARWSVRSSEHFFRIAFFGNSTFYLCSCRPLGVRPPRPRQSPARPSSRRCSSSSEPASRPGNLFSKKMFLFGGNDLLQIARNLKCSHLSLLVLGLVGGGGWIRGGGGGGAHIGSIFFAILGCTLCPWVEPLYKSSSSCTAVGTCYDERDGRGAVMTL